MNQIIVCSAERIDHVYNANYDYITNFCLIKDSCKRYDIYKDCPDDFIVDAALLSQTGRVNRGNYSLDRSSLTFNGAIASYLQPYFNTGNNGFGVRNYFYDNNLLYCPPPFFPTGTEYSIDLWEEL